MLLRTVCRTEKNPDTCRLFCANQCQSTLDGIIEELSGKVATMDLIDCKKTLDVATTDMLVKHHNPLAVREASANVTTIMFKEMYTRVEDIMHELKGLCEGGEITTSSAKLVKKLSRTFEKLSNQLSDEALADDDMLRLMDLYQDVATIRKSCKILDLTPDIINTLETTRRKRRLHTPNTTRRVRSAANRHYGPHTPSSTEIAAMQQEQRTRDIDWQQQQIARDIDRMMSE